MKRLRFIFVLIVLMEILSCRIGYATNYTCATATSIPVNWNTCSNTNGNTTGATSDGLGGVCSSGTATHTVWYSFVALSPTQTITATGSGGMDIVVEIYGSCGGGQLVCADATGANGTETINYTTYTPGNTYYVRIYDFNGGKFPFTLCVSASNDPCTGAQPLTSSSSCVPTNGTIVGATLSPGTLCSNGGNTVGDVWYTFVAQSTNPTITAVPSGFDLVIELRAIACGGAGSGSISCKDANGLNGTETLLCSSLTIGTTYAIRIYNYDNNSGTFTICVTDACSPPVTQASNITFSTIQCSQMDLAWTNGNGTNRIVVASTSAIGSTPSSGTNYAANAVFGSGATIGAGQYVVYNGSSNSVTVTGLTAGVTYYFRVFEYSCASWQYITAAATGNPASQATGSTATVASAGPDQFICASPATLAGNAAGVGTGTWSIINPTGSPAVITTPSSNTTTVTGIPASSYVTLRWTISGGGCTSTSDDVVIRTQ